MSPTFEVTVADDGKVRTRCQNCRAEIVLDPEDEPLHPTAMKLAAVGLICELCSDRITKAEELNNSAKARAVRIRASRLPNGLRGMIFDEMILTPAREQAVQAAREWAVHGGGLVLYGPTGAGKTRLAATAAWERLSVKSVRWVSVAVLIAELGAAFSDSARREAVKVITGEHGLILDDFDKVNPSEWAKSQLFAAIDRRVQAGSDLLVTTNLKPGKLKEKFGEPIASRLAGMKTVELVGPDYRLSLDDLPL